MYGYNQGGYPVFNNDQSHPTMGGGPQQSPSGKGHGIKPEDFNKSGAPHRMASTVTPGTDQQAAEPTNTIQSS